MTSHSRSTEEAPELTDALVVGSVSSPHHDRVRVQPDQVSALQPTVPLDSPKDRDAQPEEGLRLSLGLGAPGPLPHVAEDDAVFGQDGCVPDVDGVHARRRMGREEVDLGPETFQQGDEGVVLVRGPGKIGFPMVTQLSPLGVENVFGGECLPRMLQEDPFQGPHLGLPTDPFNPLSIIHEGCSFAFARSRWEGRQA